MPTDLARRAEAHGPGPPSTRPREAGDLHRKRDAMGGGDARMIGKIVHDSRHHDRPAGDRGERAELGEYVGGPYVSTTYARGSARRRRTRAGATGRRGPRAPTARGAGRRLPT